ncbi:MAG: DUF885 domain-containing protein [Pseudomonadota bacterium]
MKLLWSKGFVMRHAALSLLLSAVFCIFTVGALSTAHSQSETEQIDSLEQIIADYDAFARAGSPEAMARHEKRKPDRWSTVTPSYVANRAEAAADLLARIDALPEDDRFAGPEIAILRHLLSRDIDAYRFDTARIPLVGDWGFFANPHFTAGRTRLLTREDAEAWTARLHDVPRFFDENVANMRRGIATDWTAHSDPLKTAMAQIREQIVSDPEDSTLFIPFESLTAGSLSEAEIEVLKTDGKAAVMDAVAAYEETLQFLETEYLPAARPGPGLATLEGGQSAYAAAVTYHTAGSGLSPEDVHQLGLSEVARIRADMETIIEEVDFDGSFADFTNFLRTDPQFYAQTPQQLIAEASEMSKRLDGLMPSWFARLPRLPYAVQAVPAAIAPGYTTGRYSSGDLSEGRAGTYWVNTYRLNQRPLYELPALSAHEAVPGHHHQIAIAQELQDVPEFRRSYYATAFGEGWGLYAEKLAGEGGFYRTPYERFGQLSYEMWRACRLVADTGLHWYGWSREEAETCFKENTALAPLNIETEVTRYIGWPGQATAYKVGELKILELRAYAKGQLGEAFDIRTFHDHLLGAGAMPLDAMETRIKDWVEAQKAEAL